MNQQINLYQPIFRKQPKIFSAATVLQMTGIFVLALLLIYIYSLWQSAMLSRQTTQLNQQLQTDTARLAQLEKVLPSHAVNPALQTALKSAMAQHNLKQQALAALAKRTYGVTSGFSGQLMGLARQHLSGLWLTEIRLARGGADFEMGGETVDPRLLPEYLQRLARVPVFRGTEFGMLRIERPKKDRRALSFRISTALNGSSAQESAHASSH
ncbi:MAG: hypothetical protein ACYDB9_07485 [Gammaproteobacteria bacterium]